MHVIVKAMMLAFAIIHLLPLSGVLGAAQLEKLYGIGISDPNMIIMMRHRAVLFALLAVFVGYSAFRPDLIWLGIVAGLISAAAFIVIAWSVGGYNASIARVVLADIIAVACLIVAAVCQAMAGR
jgi:hypothetical protein